MSNDKDRFSIDDSYYDGLSFWLIIITMIVIAIVVSSCVPEEISLIHASKPDLKIFLFFLAFIVSLSSYLASVVREAAKKTSDNQTCPKDMIRHKKNIFWMVSAEVPLIILAVLSVIRLFIKSTELAINIDHFLLSFLSVILIWMACLHFRIWCIYKPWDISSSDADSK